MAERPARPPAAFEEFVFHARKPSLSYSFGIEHDRRVREVRPFEEHEALRFSAECIWPDKLKGREAEASIYPEPALVDHKLLAGDDVLKRWIGYVRVTKGEFEVSLRLPPSVCWKLGDAMALGLVTSFLANCRIESRSMHRVIHAAFRGSEFDAVEYVA